MDVKLPHPVWKDFLDTVNTVVLTGIKKSLKIQMNFLDNKTTISYYFGPSSTF
jgi:hypothetical protein